MRNKIMVKEDAIEQDEIPVCFVLMPISDPEGYSQGHFKRVYQDILKPACEMAGYRAVRADEVSQTNLIQLDILQKLLDAPMVLCDLSNRNPNVMFELGVRQAFDKPVVLVQKIGTKPIFDIAPLRYTDYRNQRIYDEVVEDQKKIAESIIETNKEFSLNLGVNSIVKLLSLTKSASLKDLHNSGKDTLLQLIRAEISGLRQEFRESITNLDFETKSITNQQIESNRRKSLLESSRLNQLPKLPPRKSILNDTNSNINENINLEDISFPTTEDDDIPF